MKEIGKSYRHLLKKERIHLPPVVARIHGGNDTTPLHYHPFTTFGEQLKRSEVMACLLGNRSLLIAGQKKKGTKRPRDWSARGAIPGIQYGSTTMCPDVWYNDNRLASDNDTNNLK
jgi:hypothetical protein